MAYNKIVCEYENIIYETILNSANCLKKIVSKIFVY